MKRNSIGRAALATITSMALGLGITACSRDYTAAYVYAVSAQGGGVSAFAVDYQSGSLVQIAGSPFTTSLSNPVTLLTAPNGKYVYVIGGSQDNKITTMAIGTDGKLYGQTQKDIPGGTPTAAAIDPSGSFLYVTFKYQTGYTTASPGPGGLAVFPISATDNTLGTPFVQNVGNNPVGVAVGGLQACNTSTVDNTTKTCPSLPPACVTIAAEATTPGLCHFVYVLDADTSSSGTGQGQILGFLQGTPTSLSTVPRTTITTNPAGQTVGTGFSAGTTPTAIVVDPTSRFVYVTDRASNQLYGYVVQASTSPGSLLPMATGPFITGLYPVSLTIDPRGKFMYVANFGASTVSSYALDAGTGVPAGVVGTGNANVGGTGPTCVTIEPALGIYLYTSNQISNQIAGQQLDPHNGSLKAIQNSPYDAGTLLSCVASAANGEHASSLVNP
jgi:6-phosphogluconolactonase